MQYQKFDLFPTSVLRFNTTTLFTAQEINSLTNEIDSIINDSILMQFNDYTPKWQSKPVLFNSIFTNKNHLWKKLKTSFEECCLEYLKLVKNFSNNQDDIFITGSRAWFYKYDMNFSNEKNPWHCHYPSYLSGVFYLSSDNTSFNGTEFSDPRASPSTSTRDVEISPILNTWVIFPGWLNHRTSSPTNKENNRYVIAADCYVSISCI